MRRSGGEKDFESHYYDRGLLPPKFARHYAIDVVGGDRLTLSLKDELYLNAVMANNVWPEQERMALVSALLALENITNAFYKPGTENFVTDYMTFFMALSHRGLLKHHKLLAPARYWSLIRPAYYALCIDDDEYKWVIDPTLTHGYVRFNAWKPYRSFV